MTWDNVIYSNFREYKDCYTFYGEYIRYKNSSGKIVWRIHKSIIPNEYWIEYSGLNIKNSHGGLRTFTLKEVIQYLKENMGDFR